MPAPFRRRLRAFRRQIGPSALEGFRELKVSSASTNSAQASEACRSAGRAQKPMTPTKRRRRMEPAELPRSWPGSCPRSSRARDRASASFLRRCAIGVLVSVLKVRPQLLQRNRKSPCERPQPTISRPAQWGHPSSRHALDAGRSEARPPGAALAALLGGSCQPRRLKPRLAFFNASTTKNLPDR